MKLDDVIETIKKVASRRKMSLEDVQAIVESLKYLEKKLVKSEKSS